MRAIMVNEDNFFGGEMSGMDSKKFRQQWKADKEWQISDAEILWDQIIDFGGSGGSIISITGASATEYKDFSFSFNEGELAGTYGSISSATFSYDGYDYYTSSDIAAFAWARKEGYSLGIRDAAEKETEWASLIFEKIDKGTGVRYYSYTKPDKFKTFLKRYGSPGPDADPKKFHGKLPKGATLYGYIHLHWEGSEYLDPSNIGFSRSSGGGKGDMLKMDDFPNLKFYVVGSTGILWARNPAKMAPNRAEWPTDTDAKKIYRVAENVYGPGAMTNLIPLTFKDLIPCKLE